MWLKMKMKMNNNQIIHDMYTEDLMQVENIDKIHFDTGIIREEHETFEGTKFDIAHYYIKSAGIYFPISKDSADAILAKIERLSEIKKDIEEITILDLEEKRRKEKKVEAMKPKEYDSTKRTEWIFHKATVYPGSAIDIPNDAIGITSTYVAEHSYVSWLEPNKK